MRILCLAVLLNTLPQLLKKFDAEVRRLRELEPDTHGFVLGPRHAAGDAGLQLPLPVPPL